MKIFSLFILLSFTYSAHAALVIHGVELRNGKEHQYGNEIHPYGPHHAWLTSVLPKNTNGPTPIIVKNADGSTSVFFETLKELLTSAVDTANQKHEKISLLTIEADGIPGQMWFPKDDQQKNKPECDTWRNLEARSGKEIFEGGYKLPSKERVLAYREMGQKFSGHPCTTSISDWQDLAQQIPNIKSYFDSSAEIRIFACLVGLGPVGENFSVGVAKALLNGSASRVLTVPNFILGDWSMSEGMGFWEYQDEMQLQRDSIIYLQTHSDRTIMQKGTVRLSRFYNSSGDSKIIPNQEVVSTK